MVDGSLFGTCCCYKRRWEERKGSWSSDGGRSGDAERRVLRLVLGRE
jgi:hypothetical protein